MQHYPKSPASARDLSKVAGGGLSVGQTYNLAESSLPALNLATFFALILITAPV